MPSLYSLFYLDKKDTKKDNFIQILHKEVNTMDFSKARMNVAKVIGEPINPNLPVPVEISAIANIDIANPGEKVYRFDDIDTRVDTILAVNTSTGAITQVKVSPLGDTEVAFSHLNSEMLYVLISDVLDSIDTDVLGRKKGRISHGMDKKELKSILDACIARSALGESNIVQQVVPETGDDVYDLIIKMKHLLEDYGDNYVLLEGSTIKEKIDTYDKDKASSFNYNVTLKQQLAQWGIKELKIFGTLEATTSGGSGAVLLDKNKMILIAINSRIASGKPITFVRRRIPPEIAQLMGADVDNAQRALWIGDTPVNVTGTDTLGFSVLGYESVVMAITNPYAIVVSPDISDYL